MSESKYISGQKQKQIYMPKILTKNKSMTKKGPKKELTFSSSILLPKSRLDFFTIFLRMHGDHEMFQLSFALIISFLSQLLPASLVHL